MAPRGAHTCWPVPHKPQKLELVPASMVRIMFVAPTYHMVQHELSVVGVVGPYRTIHVMQTVCLTFGSCETDTFSTQHAPVGHLSVAPYGSAFCMNQSSTRRMVCLIIVLGHSHTDNTGQ